MIRAQESGVLVDGSTRTIRRWVDAAAEQLAEEEYDERWRYLGPHDLRRTWGHLILEAEVLPSVVMQWGRVEGLSRVSAALPWETRGSRTVTGG